MRINGIHIISVANFFIQYKLELNIDRAW